MFKPSFFYKDLKIENAVKAHRVQEQVEECVDIDDYSVGSLQQLRAQQLL